MNREGKKCVLYPRVSTEMQVDGYSLEGQKNSLKRFADREEMEIVGIYEDAGKSGKSIEGRPAFKKMLSDIKNGLEIEYILVYKLSRFGRNAADILNSLEFVQSYGINLICIEEGIDSSQTSGKLLISVLSAVAEIERENIIEQTMNGRREKARQGGWNGGFAPYGYYLKDNQLLIEETEAEAIRIIFDKFGNSDIGLGGVAKYLNLQGIKKIPRQNGKLETWSSHLIRQILDNPVYCGKIAYGRRTREKVKGTKNEYKQVHTDDYILEDGQHEGIVSEELWQKVHAKRKATGVKQPSKVGKDRSHLLTGVLKCPICGSSMYTNKHAWTNKDGTYKEVYYYICGRNKQERGHHCDYKASLRKIDIEPLVVEAVKELVSDAYFAKEIEKRIGVQTDTSTVDKELANYENKLKEVDLNKARLENEIDNLPADARFRERKIHDMTLRLDALYDTMVELEERIEDAKLRKSSIEMEAITLDNVYKIMQNFGKLYAIMSDEEKKSLITYLIKEIQIYPNGESEMPLKSIEFNFPIYVDGRQVRKVLWERGNTVESDIDVSQYFTIDSNAGTAVYSLVSKETDGSVTGEGTLDGSILNIKNTGIFKVKVITVANGNYAACEAVITLTVENGTILYNATDYSGTYDGKPHSISVDVMSPSSTNVTYSTDGKTYSTNNPVFTDAGEYTVCYKIEKSNYDTVTGEKKVVIAKKDLEVKVDDQKIVWGNDIDNTKYNVSGLTEGDGISEITLKASTTALTDNGTISVSSIAITNGSKDVTSNYDIALSDGKLVIEHNTSLAPTRLDAHKKKTAYEAGEILNVDDITVTAYYEDGYSEQITGYTTNADELDMNTVGEKILAVSYTKNGDTKTCRFKIIVTHTHGFDNAVWHSDSINHWKECTKSYCDKSDGYKIQEISHTCEYTYTWSDDYKTCTAVRKCSICEYTDSETAASDIVVVQNRDCTNPEIIEYVARFKNSLYNDFETQIKGNFEAAPATGHNMSEWTSNRDNTHSRICTNSGCTYKETEKCSGGTATYFKKAICDDCKAEHGDFKADTIKPTGEIKLSDNTWNTLLNKITFGRFFSATQKVTIAGTDDSYSSDGFNLSEDAVKISYLLASGDEAKAYTTDELDKRFTAGEFKNYKASFNVNPDNKYVVFARIEDHAGNATYISSDGVVIDSTTPVIDGVAEGEIYCEKVEFTVSDDNFDKVTDIIGDDVQTLTSINGRYILADGMHKVIAYDKAGNSTEVNFVVNANHTVSEWMTDKEATIEETGSRHKECKVCGTILEKADIEKLVPLEYKIIAGADSSWSQNTDMNLVIKGNGDFAKFIRIKVDGVSVDATNYTVAEGSTIITLKPDYIKTLSVGSHVFEIIWKDGIASTSFTIVNNEVADTNNNQGTDIIQTGDTAKPVLWSMLFMVSFAGFAVMSGRRKKKNCK